VGVSVPGGAVEFVGVNSVLRLDDDLVAHNQIWSVFCDEFTLVEQRYTDLACEREARGFQFDADRGLIQ